MDLSTFIVSEDIPVIEALKTIDKNGHGVVFICEDERLRAVVSDGDIRRYILKNGDLNHPVREIANYSPQFIKNNSSYDIQDYIRRNRITALPVLDEKGKIVRIEFDNQGKVYRSTRTGADVVIMAGGRGSRLAPYTQVLPKPLIPIGDKTITEHIIERFNRFGCENVYMIVNYKKNFIKTYFSESLSCPEENQEEKRREKPIRFIDEEEFLGTGGGLKLLEGKLREDFFLTNCDILVEEDYSEILNYHKEQGNIITLVCAAKNIEIPYGTIQVSGEGRVTGLTEKPNLNFLTNTGLYVIRPDFLNRIGENEYVDITDVIKRCIGAGEKVGMYPVSESAWLDMGQIGELERMRKRLGYMD